MSKRVYQTLKMQTLRRRAERRALRTSLLTRSAGLPKLFVDGYSRLNSSSSRLRPFRLDSKKPKRTKIHGKEVFSQTLNMMSRPVTTCHPKSTKLMVLKAMCPARAAC